MNDRRAARKGQKGFASRTAGFTLLEIMFVVTLIGLLTAIALPNFVRAQTLSHQATCINNLRQIRGAVTEWALEHKAGPKSPVQYSDIKDFLHGNVICPSGGSTFGNSYLLIDVQTPPVCLQVAEGPNAHTEPTDVTK